MARLNTYQDIARALINRYAQFEPAYGDIDIKTIVDDTQRQYQLLYVGWNKHKRIHNIVLHLELRGGVDDCKVWIQYDGIEGGVAEELVEAGVPREHIVLGFQPEKVRPFTDYATT